MSFYWSPVWNIWLHQQVRFVFLVFRNILNAYRLALYGHVDPLDDVAAHDRCGPTLAIQEYARFPKVFGSHIKNMLSSSL
eukprot:3915865-Pyramimonas_sp.AAC.1